MESQSPDLDLSIDSGVGTPKTLMSTQTKESVPPETVEHRHEVETRKSPESKSDGGKHALLNVFNPHRGVINPTQPPNFYSHFGQSSTKAPTKGQGSYYGSHRGQFFTLPPGVNS